MQLAGCITVSPVYYDEEKQIAEAAVRRYHELYNQQKYKEMYEFISPNARDVVSFEGFRRNYEQQQAKYGRIVESKRTAIEVKPEASYRTIIISFDTRFERGELSEKYVLAADSNEAIIYDMFEPVPK